MVQYSRARLDASFAALSDATRRGVLEQLGRSDASITDLAETFHMTLTGMKKHVGVLEQAGLVTTKKIGRVRTCQLGPRRLARNSHERRRAMNARIESKPSAVKNRTTVERKSDREVVVTRTINGPARIVFEACSKAELLKRWWVPKSMGMTLLSCEEDARVGGKYRLEFDGGGPGPAAFFGTYVEVKPYSRLAWTNEEGGEGGPVTTVTFEEKGGKTLVVLHESYPSKEALDAAGTGAADAMVETFNQLDELLVALGESSGQ